MFGQEQWNKYADLMEKADKLWQNGAFEEANEIYEDAECAYENYLYASGQMTMDYD